MNKKRYPGLLTIVITTMACTISLNLPGGAAPSNEVSMAEAVAGTQTAAAPLELPAVEPSPEEPNPEVQPQEAPPADAPQPEGDAQTPLQSPADLTIWQTLLRYDGQQPQGTFEITVCNLGVETAPPFEADLTANGVTRRLAASEALAQYGCVSLFDPASNFETFSITQTGNVTVSAVLYPASEGDPPDNNTSQTEVALPSIGPVSGNSMPQYLECRKQYSHNDCMQFLPQDPPADPPMIKKQSGPFIVLAPSADSYLAAGYLADNVLCAERLETYLGFPPQHPITQHLIYSEGSGMVHSAAMGILMEIPEENEAVFSNLVDYYPNNWEATLKGDCHNEHEMTHLFLKYLPLPGWLNEGLATYMEGGDRITSEQGGPLECRENGWYGEDWNDGQIKENPYLSLTAPYDPIMRRYYYYSTSCFWDYLESSYGHEKFQQIMQQLVSYRDPIYAECSPERKSIYFIRDIVRPIIGDDISPITQARWGFGETYTGCE